MPAICSPLWSRWALKSVSYLKPGGIKIGILIWAWSHHRARLRSTHFTQRCSLLQPDFIRSGSIHKNNECIIPYFDPLCLNIPFFFSRPASPFWHHGQFCLSSLTFISICCWLQINKREDRWETRNFASSNQSQWDLKGRKLHCGSLGVGELERKRRGWRKKKRAAAAASVFSGHKANRWRSAACYCWLEITGRFCRRGE